MVNRLIASVLLVVVVCVSFPFCTSSNDVSTYPEALNVHLVCPISSIPKWKKDNKTIEADDKGYQIVPENKTLIINKIDQAHMGVYVCTDENNGNQNQTVTITVYVSPYVKSFEKTKNVIEDDPLQLECKGYGYPTPVVEWYKRGGNATEGRVAIKAGQDDRITIKDTQATSDGSTGLMINGTIRIVKMATEDNGDYECLATNDYGTNNATIKVQVKDKLAALWPFLGICAEVAILCTIIFFYEKRRAKKMQEEEDRATEEAERLNANNETKGNDEVRQRK